MKSDMTVIKTVAGIKIYYSPFFERFIVLLPKGDGHSQMERFPSAEEAERFIQQDKEINVQGTNQYWWMN